MPSGSTIDAAGGDDAELRIAQHGEAAQNSHRKDERENAGVDGEKTRTGQGFHVPFLGHTATSN